MKLNLPFALLALGFPGATQAFAPPKPTVGPNTGLNMAVELEQMTSKRLKKLVQASRPGKAAVRGMKTREEKINFLKNQEKWSNTPGASTFGLSASGASEAPFAQATKAYPGALTNKEFVTMVSDVLTANGYDPKKTLVATSLCCDEVNRPLEAELIDSYDTHFNMGGLAGFPFGGKTSFGAMAAHIPDGGSCAVVYGPHVGVDHDGSIGTVERRGRAKGGACCGSAVAASGYVASVLTGDVDAKGIPDDALDAQQAMVGELLLPYAERLEKAANKMQELPLALYDAQSKLMGEIVSAAAGGVGPDGTIAVIGGVQINTPPDYSDYFLPLKFDLYNNKGQLVDNLMDKSGFLQRPFPKATEVYPGAVTNAELLEKITSTLTSKGYDTSKMLVATSLCCDEVNRPLEMDLMEPFDTNFNMGGLAGFPFGGATSFGAMASHIPDGGSCLVVYGPHVGVDSTGKAGTVERRGKNNGGSCCGSAVAACGYVSSVFKGEAEPAGMPDISDAQQWFVGKMLLPYAERLNTASNTMVELPLALYDAQSELMERIVKQSCGAVADGNIAVLGGVQINTPPSYSDYFLPKSFKLYNNKGELLEENLL